MAERYVNDVHTTLSAAINSSTTTIPFTSVVGVPTTGEFAFIIDNEIFKGLSVSGSNVTVATRGQEGTAAASHTSGAPVWIVLTARALQALTPYSAANQLLYGNSSLDAVPLSVSTPNTLLHGGNPPTMAQIVAADIAAGVAWTKLAETILGVATAGIFFSSIPQTYKALVIDYLLRSDVSGSLGYLYVIPNIGTGLVTDTEIIYGFGTSVAGSEDLNDVNAIAFNLACPAASAPAGVAAMGRIYIPFYADTNWNKVLQITHSLKWDVTTTTVQSYSGSAFVHSSAAISAVSLYPGSGNWVANSRATVWGVPA